MNIPRQEDLNCSTCTARSMKVHYPEFLQMLENKYPDLDHKERLYWYYNNITERPKCRICGKETSFIDWRHGYREFCGYKCMNSCSDIQERKKITTMKNYGCENPMKNASVKEKLKNTFRRKYGVDNPFQSEEVKAAIRETNMKKLGVKYPMQSKYVLNKSSKTIETKYGVKWNCQRAEANNYGNNSKPNSDFAKLLDENNILYEREYVIENRSYDFKIENILVEINPFPTHNATFGIANRKGMDKNYHYEKTLLAKKYGFRCVHVWDWDDQEKILNILRPKTSIYARECSIKYLKENDCNEFLSKYHIQSTCQHQTVMIGLYYKDDLVGVMTFGKPRYNKKFEWELLRLCIKPSHIIIGGPEKLFRFFVKYHNPQSIVSYCDNSKFEGKVYSKLGFILEEYGHPNKHWFNGKMHITNNLLLQRGFDQLFHENYGKGTSNEQLMIEHKFVEIYDSGQSRYAWKNNS